MLIHIAMFLQRFQLTCVNFMHKLIVIERCGYMYISPVYMDITPENKEYQII